MSNMYAVWYTIEMTHNASSRILGMSSNECICKYNRNKNMIKYARE